LNQSRLTKEKNMDQVREIIEQVTSTLSDVAQSDVVVGTPLEVGGVTVVPICRLATGFGGGGGEGTGDGRGARGNKDGSGKGRAGATAGGAIVRPVAVVVFGPDGVQVLPIPEKLGKLERFLDQIPGLVERFQSRS
jgi:uncharacterized spore protein YtfJ